MSLPKIFLSSRHDTNSRIEKTWLKKTGCIYRCFTYANVSPEAIYYSKGVAEALTVCENTDGVEIMMDSGAHSIHKIAEAAAAGRSDKHAKKQSIDIEELKEKMFKNYSSYCLKNSKKWSFYLTLDYKKSQPVIYEMQLRFEKIGLRPLPVYHGDSSIDWLKKYIDLGHNFICLGGDVMSRDKGRKGRRRFLDQVFNYTESHKIRVHGLAQTSLSGMTSYPYYSVDSATWAKNAGSYGTILYPDFERNQFFQLHVSRRESKTVDTSYNRLPKEQRREIEKTVEKLGWDIQELRDDDLGGMGRHEFNGYIYSNLDKLGIDFEHQASKKAHWEILF
jgi:hypothetical protein